MSDERPREDGPTEVVETEEGELVERLSGGTATVLLAWLIGVGALSTLLAVWIFVWVVSGERLGTDVLFGGFGIYTSIAGGAGPCVLWLAGRAQAHTLGWFMQKAAKIALVMLGIVLLMIVLATLIMADLGSAAGRLLTVGVVAAAVAAVMAVLLSQIWAVATWAADRWIARARISEQA